MLCDPLCCVTTVSTCTQDKGNFFIVINNEVHADSYNAIHSIRQMSLVFTSFNKSRHCLNVIEWWTVCSCVPYQAKLCSLSRACLAIWSRHCFPVPKKENGKVSIKDQHIESRLPLPERVEIRLGLWLRGLLLGFLGDVSFHHLPLGRLPSKPGQQRLQHSRPDEQHHRDYDTAYSDHLFNFGECHMTDDVIVSLATPPSRLLYV